MSMPLILSMESDDDVVEIYAKYEQIRKGLGKRFLKYLHELFNRIELMPTLYGEVAAGIRAAPTKKFRYVVYYRIHSDFVEVIGIIHGSRNSSVWKSRI